MPARSIPHWAFRKVHQLTQKQFIKGDLVISDSITVSEIERGFLQIKVTRLMAFSGIDGWNALRAGQYLAIKI